MYNHVFFLDGYLDEPSSLGVPPYLSPYSRYIYGLLLDTGLQEEDITYLTIDDVRKRGDIRKQLDSSLVIILAGTTVPGNYLGGKPISLEEIRNLSSLIKGDGILVGPITQCGFKIEGIHQAKEEALTFLYQLLTGKEYHKSYQGGVAHWSILGASLTKRHPSFPYLICELETYRGCLRERGCSFCSEPLKKITYTRHPRELIEEVFALYQGGNRYFRLGSQPDLILYGAKKRPGHYPLPTPSYLETLYQGIWQVAPKLKVLHMDNGGPRSLVQYPQRGWEILDIITSWNTPGDVMAMGLESAHDQVLLANSIGTTVLETREAIKMVNRLGGRRVRGIPLLLPGLNLLHGLKGEDKGTFQINYSFLKDLMEEGLLFRRVNIRQVRTIGDYKGKRTLNSYRFLKYKERINQEINRPMLRQVFPKGTILPEVLVEKKRGHLSFGRPLGSYPILVGIPGDHPKGSLVTVSIIDHGYRSVTALIYPLPLNSCSFQELCHLPGIGKKRAQRLLQKRPFSSYREVSTALDADYPVDHLRPYCTFG